MKAGDCKQWRQIRRARAVSVVLYSLSTQIHSNHFFRGAEDKVIVKILDNAIIFPLNKKEKTEKLKILKRKRNSEKKKDQLETIN